MIYANYIYIVLLWVPNVGHTVGFMFTNSLFDSVLKLRFCWQRLPTDNTHTTHYNNKLPGKQSFTL